MEPMMRCLASQRPLRVSEERVHGDPSSGGIKTKKASYVGWVGATSPIAASAAFVFLAADFCLALRLWCSSSRGNIFLETAMQLLLKSQRPPSMFLRLIQFLHISCPQAACHGLRREEARIRQHLLRPLCQQTEDLQLRQLRQPSLDCVRDNLIQVS